MKKFKFNLETVHNVREMQQEKEQLRLAELQNLVNQTIAHIEQLEQTKLSALNNYRHKMEIGESMSSFELKLNSDHISDLNRRQLESRVKLEKQKSDCTDQTKKLAAAHREVKVTDRLRETQEIHHKKELERHEQNTIDEIVTINYARRVSGIK